MDRWRREFPSTDDALDAALLGGRRGAVVQAAVVHADLAERVEARLPHLLARGEPKAQAVALAAGHALCARRLTGPVCAAWSTLVGVRDPLDRDQTLAHRALDYLIDVARPGHAGAQACIRAAMATPGLRLEAWRALGEAEASATLPYLAALLTEAPQLAAEVGTRYALVHTEHVLPASEALAGLPEATRRAYAAALEKHLKRIFAVRRWVTCRRALFGR